MFLEVGVASTGVPGYRPGAPRADWGPGRAQSLPWRYASREGRAVRAVVNAGGTRGVEVVRPLLPARPSRRSSRLNGSGGLILSRSSRSPRVGGSPVQSRQRPHRLGRRGAKRQADSVRDHCAAAEHSYGL